MNKNHFEKQPQPHSQTPSKKEDKCIDHVYKHFIREVIWLQAMLSKAKAPSL